MWISAVTALLVAIVGGIIGAFANTLVQHLYDRRKQRDNRLFEIYMQLMELKGLHFWIVSREARGERPDPALSKQFRDASWRIADAVRLVDAVPEIEQVLRTMFLLTFKTEDERAKEFNQVIDLLGKRVNPRYATAVRKIDAENERLMASDPEEYCRRLRNIQG